ncbi:MAG: M20/M25/M40 family metallo-hydrolase [Planctomycetes bacterium]|nr:M20/M25/M40 family metallo-hydrolase [Planctomycetota bacterium]
MSWTRHFLDRYLRIPSVSAQGTGMREAVALLVETFRELGCEARVIETSGNPVVFAEKKTPGAAKTLLVYNHYDVQPPEPFDEWISPPWVPTERDGKLFARGVADNKANLAVRLGALKSLGDRLPVNLKFTVEGEEEVGSPSLEGFVAKNRALLAADACLWETGGKDEQGRPDIICGVKGILHAEAVAKGPSRDLHSSVGVAVPSPAWSLVHALAGLRAPDGVVTLPGFYDKVRRADAADREALRAMPYDEEARKKLYGIKEFVGGVSGEDLKEALVFKPTININGLMGGYQGKGSKTVLPKEARAKFDVRLVPDQDPVEVEAALRKYLAMFGVELVEVHGYPPARTPVDSAVVKAAVESAREAYGKEPWILPLMPASGPMYVYRALMPCVSFGAGWPGANIHAPNESVQVADLAPAQEHVRRFLQNLAAVVPEAKPTAP